jgi:glycosyltransferase involved in cell wall biosynthesis
MGKRKAEDLHEGLLMNLVGGYLARIRINQKELLAGCFIMNNPLVSIIMPAYNTEKYVERSIQSVVDQIYTNWELLVIDDCSTDNTKNIIKAFLKTDTRIKPIFNNFNNGTPAKAKNKALPLVKGDYVAFLDSDDMWLRDKLMKQISFMDNNPQYGLTYTGGYLIDESSRKINTFLPKYKCGNVLHKMLRRYEINNQSVIIREEALQAIGGLFNEDIVIGEDYNLFMNILAKYEVCNIKECLVKYRIHSDSISKNKSIDLSDGTLKTLKELNAKYKIKKKYPIYYFISWLKAVRFKFF